MPDLIHQTITKSRENLKLLLKDTLRSVLGIPAGMLDIEQLVIIPHPQRDHTPDHALIIADNLVFYAVSTMNETGEWNYELYLCLLPDELNKPVNLLDAIRQMPARVGNVTQLGVLLSSLNLESAELPNIRHYVLMRRETTQDLLIVPDQNELISTLTEQGDRVVPAPGLHPLNVAAYHNQQEKP